MSKRTPLAFERSRVGDGSLPVHDQNGEAATAGEQDDSEVEPQLPFAIEGVELQ